MNMLSRLWSALEGFTAMLNRVTTLGNSVAGDMEHRLGLPAPAEVNGDTRLPSPRRRIENGK